MQKKKASKHTGRPSGYKPEYCQKLIEIAQTCEPYNYANICCVELGTCIDVLNEWRHKNEEFRLAYKTGLEIWERRLNLEAITSKMDFKFYRSFMYRVKGITCEPPTNVNQTIEPSHTLLQHLQLFNAELPGGKRIS